jgi:hypothetical protein
LTSFDRPGDASPVSSVRSPRAAPVDFAERFGMPLVSIAELVAHL